MLAVKEDNIGAYKKLYSRYSRPIMSYIYQMTKNQAMSEELTQDVFLKVYDKRHLYEAKAKFTTWLWTIARNTTLDYLRKKKVFLLDDMKKEETATSQVDDIKSEQDDAEARLVKISQREEIEACLKKMPPFQKEALSLKIMSDLSYDEISKIIGKSISSVKSLINRARVALVDCLKSGASFE